MVTSGDYERFFVKDGVRYHHILDLKTGRPARRSMAVTVLARDATMADALSTAIFVLGPEKGIALTEKQKGVDAIIIDTEGKPHLSSGLKDKIKIKAIVVQ